jgi:hypothetical protein
MMRSSRTTSRTTAFWIASAVFFLGRRRDLSYRSQPADLLIDVQQLLTQFPEALAFGNLTLRFGQTRRRGKGFRDRFPVHLTRQSVVGTMARVPMAMTGRISTTATCSRDGTRAHIAQLADLHLKGGTTILKLSQGVGHLQPP